MGQVGIIGLEADELQSIRILLRLLRHRDPVVAELARQALDYLRLVAGRSAYPDAQQVSSISSIQ